jgi:hypothetical protein
LPESGDYVSYISLKVSYLTVIDDIVKFWGFLFFFIYFMKSLFIEQTIQIIALELAISTSHLSALRVIFDQKIY